MAGVCNHSRRGFIVLAIRICETQDRLLKNILELLASIEDLGTPFGDRNLERPWVRDRVVGDGESFVNGYQLAGRKARDVFAFLIPPGCRARGAVQSGVEVEAGLCTVGAEDFAEPDVIFDSVIPALQDLDHLVVLARDEWPDGGIAHNVAEIFLWLRADAFRPSAMISAGARPSLKSRVMICMGSSMCVKKRL